MAATTVENLEFHIKKTGMSDDGAKILKSYADALKELKQTGKGNPISQTLVKNISALAGAMKAIDAAAVSKMRQLAAALKTFDGLKGISLNAKFASVLTDIAAAADLLTDSHIDKLTRFGNALKNMQGAKTNIGDKLPEQIKNLAAAVETITDETVNRLNRLTKALSRLRGIDLRGLGSILAEQRRAGTQSAGQANGGTPSAGSKSPAAGQRGTGAGAQMNTHRQWTWSLSENVKIVADQWKRVGQAISSHVNPRIKLAASLLRGVLSVIGNIVKSIAKLGLSLIKSAVNGIANAVKKIWSTIQNITKGVAKLGVNIVKGLAKNVSNISKALATAGKSIAQFVSSRTIVSSLTESFGRLKKLFSSFSRVALYRLVRSAIKEITDTLQEGAEHAYFYAKQFGNATQYIATSMDMISSGHFKMSNQLGAAWVTLLATLEPILVQIISMVTKAAEVVTQFFALVSGHGTYLKAKDYTKAWADETEKGADAAKEWKNQLMDFDTLNRLNEPTDSAAKAAEKYKDYENMFDEVPIESWIEKLKDLKPFEIGLKIAEWLNNAMQKLDDWFLQLRPKLKKYAKDLADLLNGLITGFDWKLLGKTVADGLNAIFDAINTFLKNVKWKQLGRGVGDAIKSLFDHTEWDLIGETFANKWNALLHFIEGVVTTPGIWKSIGKGIGKFVKSWIDTIDLNSLATSVIAVINGIAEAIGNFLDQNPFQNLASKITNALNRVVMEVEWAKIGTNLGRLFQSGLNVLFDVVSKFPFEKLGWNIMQCIDNLAAQINFDQLGHLMMSIGLALWKVVYGAVEYLADTGGAKRLAERLSSFVKGALDELADWLASLDTAKIAKALKDFFGNIDYIGIRDSLVRVVKTGWQKAVELKNEIFTDETKEKMKNGIKQFFAGINWDEIKETIKTKLTTAWNWVHTKYDEWFPPEKREELKQKIFNYIAQAIMSVPWAELHNILQYSIDKAFLPDWWNNWYWSKGDYAGKETIMGMINGTDSKVGDLTNAVQNDVVDAITSASLPAEMAAMAAGAGVSDSLASGVESRKDVLENKTTSGFLDAITSASFKADSVAVTAGTNAMTSAANGVISGKPKVQTAMDGSLVQPADSAVVAFLKKIGIIQSAYAEEAGGWISTADQVKERTVGDYDVIGDKVPKSMDVMQGNLDKTTVLVAKSFQTMDTMSVQAAQSMRDKLKTAFDAAKQSVLNVAQAIDTSMVSMMSSVGTKFVEGARNLIGNIKSFIDSVKSTLGIGGGGSSVFSNIGQSMVSGMSQGFSSLWGTFSSNAVTLVSTLAQTIVSAVSAAITSAAGNITNMVSQAKSTLSNLASNARESISNIVSSSQSTLNNIVSQVGSALNNLISQANAKLQSLRGKSYATGGFPEDGLFFANHSELVGQFSNGRTAVANNAQIIEGIKRGVMEAMQASLSNINNRSGDDQAINIYIGDELVYSGYAAWNRRQQVITGGRA